ncbi:hypothetical protein FHR72_002399 [Mycolicibacterium iranicum]|uniref:Glyoxalase n=1 Tax=Mycolicibacterium iranicum TaxID=912594 RepID=A0A839Q9Q4_MYCIR|nr:glyoxalase [Mycolicibacterium iranicum]MBB2990926.1 hypothetical protein [Mycolicibacterium iranicum]
MPVTLDELALGDDADAWAAAGFTVDAAASVCRVGAVSLRLLGSHSSTGVVGWSLRGIPADLREIDGVPTTTSRPPATAPVAHANGATSIDHVVMMSPHLQRTTEALAGLGVAPRRERDAVLGGRPIRQIFFRFGEVIVEVVGSPDAQGDGPSTLWGITFAVADIDETAAFFGDRTAPVKDAVQPGRRITTLRHRELGMSVRTAFLSASR